MSLYDTLRCDYPLPDPEFQQAEFQTKDLGCALEHYHIDRIGRLWVTHVKPRFVRDDEPAGPAPEPEDTRYHGDIRFYASTTPEWVEYQARFTHGVVEWIRRFSEAETASDQALAQKAPADFEQAYQQGLEAILQELAVFDSEVVWRAFVALGDLAKAARWLGTPRRGFDYETAYELLAQGCRGPVLEALDRITDEDP